MSNRLPAPIRKGSSRSGLMMNRRVIADGFTWTPPRIAIVPYKPDWEKPLAVLIAFGGVAVAVAIIAIRKPRGAASF